jgi:hypothetical protein
MRARVDWAAGRRSGAVGGPGLSAVAP